MYITYKIIFYNIHKAISILNLYIIIQNTLYKFKYCLAENTKITHVQERDSAVTDT